MNKLTIVNMLFSSHSDHSAVHSLHLSISKTLNEKNYKVVNVLLTGKKTPNDFCGDFHWQIDPNMIRQKGFFNKLRYHSIVMRCSRFLQSLKADIVLCDGISVVHLIANVQSYYPVKALGVFHGQTRIKPVVSKRLIQHKQYWNYVAVSQSLEKYLKNQSDLFTDKNTMVIPNAIDVEKIEQSLLPRVEARKALGLAPDEFVFGFVGRLVSVKQPETIIKAVNLLKEKKSWPQHGKVVFIGDGGLKARLTNQIQLLDLQSDIKLAGLKLQAFRYLKAFDAFIISSDDREAFGIASLEACVAQLPVIASNIPVFNDILGSNALYFEVACEKNLANRMDTLLLMLPDNRQRMAARANYRTKQRFDIQLFKSRYWQLISDILKMK